ncbi:MAG TPA: RNA polymerase sigma-70 factor [Segetibacter sp.]|nr:RNA polymerase sigma-70 factor [Segetibacter sp.]
MHDQVTATLGRTDEKVFEQVFKTHFKALHSYAYTILKDDAIAEEMVQNVFFKLWEKKEQLDIQTSLKAYLYKAVYHESLNYLKHQKVKSVHQAYAMHSTAHTSNLAEKKLLQGELENKLQMAMNDLPEQCRTIFQLSRFEELKYREIADTLGLSVKTVENQMGKALKILRSKLVEFLPTIIAFINVINWLA